MKNETNRPLGKAINIRVPFGIYALLKETAERRGITVSSLVRYICVRDAGK